MGLPRYSTRWRRPNIYCFLLVGTNHLLGAKYVAMRGGNKSPTTETIIEKLPYLTREREFEHQTAVCQCSGVSFVFKKIAYKV